MLRFYGVGCYRHGLKCAAQGYDGPPLNLARLHEWGTNLNNPSFARQWIMHETPNESAEAESDPPVWSERMLPIYPGPDATVYAPRWTPRGWVYRPPEPDESTAEREATE